MTMMAAAAPSPPFSSETPRSAARTQWQPSTSSTSHIRNRLAALLLAALILLLAAGHPAFAQSFPAFTGLVTDASNVLPADRKAALEARLEAFQQRTGRQLVVATIPDLQGYAIEDYGYRLGRAWGVGLKDADNGTILMIAPNERKVRIEVGRRLEPVLTDAFSSVVINQDVLPAFKAGDLAGGIDAGADALMRQLGLPDDQAKAEAAKAAAAFDRTHRRSTASNGGIPTGFIIWMAVAFIALAMLRRRRRGYATQRYARGGGGSNWPIWLWVGSELMRGSGGSGSGGGIFGGGGGGSGGGSDGSWGGGGFTGGGGGDFGGGGASGSW